MKNRWSHVFKLCAIVLALSLFPGIFFTGADKFESDCRRRHTALPRLATSEERSDDGSPQIESMSATL